MHNKRGGGVLGLLVALSGCTGGDSDRGPARRDAAAPADDAATRGEDASQPDGSLPMRMDAGAQHDAAAVSDATVADAARPAKDAGHGSDASYDDDQDAGSGDAGAPISEDTFDMRVVASGLSSPWEITWGVDNWLWITERTDGRVLRLNPTSAEQKVALTLEDMYQDSGQNGLLGMALNLQNGFVYLAYTYDADAGAEVDRRAKIVRLSYDAAQGTLSSQTTLIEGLSASTDHNSGRLVYGPDNKLYYTIGDQGHNQFENRCLSVRAQDIPTQTEIDAHDWSAYQGKILRIELDGSTPADNPSIGGVRSHIYSYGHRNAQGIVFASDGKLYASEQGPKTDDEINLISAGKNYGWPYVAGFQDDQAYEYGNWSASSPEPCDSLPYSDYVLPDSVPKQSESTWSSADYVSPLKTFYTVDNGYNFIDPACPDNPFICWPTIAPSSLDLYDPGDNGLKTWGRALLVPSLKHGSVLRVPLSANGEATQGETTELFKTVNRYRDLAIAPDRRTFYVVTDDNGVTSGPTQGSTQTLTHRGAVLEFKSKAPP